MTATPVRRAVMFGSVIVTEVGHQPAFGHGQRLSLALAVAFDLILVDLADREVLRLGMGEVLATDRRGGQHREVLG